MLVFCCLIYRKIQVAQFQPKPWNVYGINGEKVVKDGVF